MPELPEVESVRRALGPLIVGQRVEAVRVHRRDFIDTNPADKEARSAAATPRALLVGGVISELRRRGKQLAVITADRRAIVIHLGMTGQLIALAPGETLPKHDHVHVEWELSDDVGAGAQECAGAGARGSDRAPLSEAARHTLRLLFRDPRRFGSVRPYITAEALEEHWSNELGPDALTITAAELHAALRESRMAIKAKLLDQSALAGVGNIYADESLFAAGIRPRRAARSLTRAEFERLARELRATLARAIAAGGSTLRDFISPTGSVGSYQSSHLVYGRTGQPCPRCHKPLRGTTIAQRTTVWCPNCQK